MSSIASLWNLRQGEIPAPAITLKGNKSANIKDWPSSPVNNVIDNCVDLSLRAWFLANVLQPHLLKNIKNKIILFKF